MVVKTYSLLSVGKRGAGKTVFLSGAFTALQKERSLLNPSSFWLDLDDQDTKDNISNILAYIAKTGNYPPATLRLNHFAFSLHQRLENIDEKLCHFYWWDAPGESCRLYNPAFVNMMSQADGGCFFIDANELLRCARSNPEDGNIFNQLDALATVVSHNHLIFPLAIILTKCDSFSNDTPSWQEINYRLLPLKQRLNNSALNYQIFFSSFIISTVDDKAILQSKMTSSALLWLLEQIQINHVKVAVLADTEIQQRSAIQNEPKFYSLPQWLWIWLSILLVIFSIVVITLIKMTLFPEPELPSLPTNEPSQQN